MMRGWSVLRRLSRKTKTPVNDDTNSNNDTTGTPTSMTPVTVPQTQTILLLYGPKQPYTLVRDYPVPKLQAESEVLVKTRAIGLNPIDWKAP